MADLRDYNRRRRFTETPEPAGRAGARSARPGPQAFVVQKHDATRLHYDFRLEWNGVLLSWAVTRGPSDDPSQKRLAVRTEDHPLDYAGFEGVIPEGNYGAGTVMLWDRGTWEPLVEDVAAALGEGRLKFRLDGARMRGAWALVRMRARAADRGRENWLLVKDRDAAATRAPEGLVRSHATSIATGRTMAEIARGAAARERSGPRPSFVAPQLATLETVPPSGDGWVYEVKLDGYRGQIALGRGGTRIHSRSGADWSDRFAPLMPAAEALDCDSALIDGEVVAPDATFAGLQTALTTGGPLLFYAFDLLHLDGRDLRRKPFEERRAALGALLRTAPRQGPLRESPLIRGAAGQALSEVCRAGGEGIVAKRADAPYRSGRSRAWVKLKCGHRAEFVIVGYQPSTALGRPFASLAMGSVERGRLVYRGRVGSGFDDRALASLAPLLAERRRDRAPVGDAPAAEVRGIEWVEPDMVAEIAFAGYTGEGRIRHGVYAGLREDKPAAAVAAEGGPGGSARPVRFRGVTISSPDREVFAAEGIRKRDLAAYYDRVADRMLPGLRDRPLSLLRYPDGIGGEGFFQKHKGPGFPAAIGADPAGDFMYLATPRGLLAAVQFGTVEFHVRGTRRDRLDRPDRMVFDLDPDLAVGFPDVAAAARTVRDLLAEAGLGSDPMVSGGKGIHVVVTLQRRATQETVATFARTVATLMAAREPRRFVATMSKAARRGRIFVDWLRNQREATAVAPWSVRARPGAPVAVPVGWDELDTLPGADAFGLAEAAERAAAAPAAAPAPARTAIDGRTVAALERLVGESGR